MVLRRYVLILLNEENDFSGLAVANSKVDLFEVFSQWAPPSDDKWFFIKVSSLISLLNTFGSILSCSSLGKEMLWQKVAIGLETEVKHSSLQHLSTAIQFP
jgi:hypothetical protein